MLLDEVNVAAPLQPAIAAARKEERLAFLMTPWVDKTIAVVAVIPFAWLTYIRLQSFGFDVPRVALLVQGLLFIGTMVIRKTPGPVSTNPWLWLLTIVETYWVILVFAVMRRGQRIAPYWGIGFTCHSRRNVDDLGSVEPGPQHRTGSGIAFSSDARTVPIRTSSDLSGWFPNTCREYVKRILAPEPRHPCARDLLVRPQERSGRIVFAFRSQIR